MGRSRSKVCQDLVGLAGPFTKIARAMSAQWDVRIVPSGSECSTDGNVIRIPFTADYLPADKRQILHGHLDHEVCHVAEERRHLDAGRRSPMELFRSESDKKLRSLINVFEDIRIEQRYEAIYPGMAQNIRAGNVSAASKWAADYQARTKANFWQTFGSAIILRSRHVEDGWTYEGKIAEYMDLIAEELEEAQQGGEWVDTAIDLARRVYDKVKEKHEQDQQEDDGDEDPKPKTRGDGDGDGEGQGGESDDEDGDDEGDLGSPDEDPEFEDWADAARQEMSEYVVHDAQIHGRYIPHPKAAKHDRVNTVFLNDVGAYDAAKAEVSAQIQGLRSKQRMLIMSWSRKKLRTGLERGFVDDDVLSEVRMGNRFAFADTTKRRDLNTAICGLVDCSGSMGMNEWLPQLEERGLDQCCAYYAFRTAIALAESWSALNIPNEWLGYTVNDVYPTGITRDDLAGPFFCRPPLQHFVFKGYEESLKAVRGRFAGIRGHGSNVDGEAVAWAGRRLAARPENRKILVVLCDGYPITGNGYLGGSHAVAADTSVMQNHLRQTVKALTSAGIEVLCIGAGTDAPSAYYNAQTGAKFVHITDVSTMAVDIFRIMKAKITKGAA